MSSLNFSDVSADTYAVTPMDGESTISLVREMATLAAIPIILLALWADREGNRIAERLKAAGKPGEEFNLEETQAGIHIAGLIAFITQIVLFLINPEAREEYPLLSVAILVGAISIQNTVMNRLEGKLSKVPRPRPDLVPLLRPKTPAASTPLQSGARPGAGPWLWMMVTVVSYMVFVHAALMGSFLLAQKLGLPKGWMAAVVLGSGGIGIFLGLAFNFALAPFHLRKILPTTRMDDPQLMARIEASFTKAGLQTPETWVIETQNGFWQNAMVAGFSWGKGWFKPGIFFTRSLIQGYSDAELETIIRHEISHIALSHLPRRLFFSVAVIGSTTVASGVGFFLAQLLLPPAMSPIGLLFAMILMVGVPFSSVIKQIQRHEEEADRYAVETLGAEASLLITTLKKLEKAGDPHQTGRIRPSVQARIDELEKLIPAEAPASSDLDQAA